MDFSPRSAIAAFARRSALGAFVGGALQAGLPLGVLAAGTLIALRLAGVVVAPHPLWALAVGPLLLAGLYRLRRDRLPFAMAAQHLDRRLQAGGLLLTAAEGVPLPDGWSATLQQRLQDRAKVQPTVRWGELLPRPLAALLLAAVVAFWPGEVVRPAQPQSFAGLAALERLETQLQDLLRGEVPTEVAGELRDKLQQLQEQLQQGGPPDWRELDELAQRLGREGLLAAARRMGEGGQRGGAATAEAAKGLAEAAAAMLGDAALREGLPAGLAAMLEQAVRPGGLLDPQQLLRDPAALRALAQALGGAAQRFQGDGGAARLGKEQLARLQQLVGRAGDLGKHLMVRQGEPGRGGEANAAGGAGASGAGATGAGSGGQSGADGGPGGLGRGPGFAALRLTDDAQGGADGAMVLPPGAAVPSDWVPIAENRSEPDVAPVRNDGAGGAGRAGLGGASWQLQLAPRHRAVVQRFFPGGSADATPKVPR
ncbi:MAG: hypothetical protein JNL12_14805 [Planctomycetes bacterium]|nr:hypothetical protein [Planctomycetota bacterium]